MCVMKEVQDCGVFANVQVQVCKSRFKCAVAKKGAGARVQVPKRRCDDARVQVQICRHKESGAREGAGARVNVQGYACAARAMQGCKCNGVGAR